MATIPDDDPEELSSVLTVPTNSDCWVSCHTKEQVEDFQDQLERVKQKQRHKNQEKAPAHNVSKLKVGVEVWTRHKDISDLLNNTSQKGNRFMRINYAVFLT